jgi:hypothetical protein
LRPSHLDGEAVPRLSRPDFRLSPWPPAVCVFPLESTNNQTSEHPSNRATEQREGRSQASPAGKTVKHLARHGDLVSPPLPCSDAWMFGCSIVRICLRQVSTSNVQRRTAERPSPFPRCLLSSPLGVERWTLEVGVNPPPSTLPPATDPWRLPPTPGACRLTPVACPLAPAAFPCVLRRASRLA